MQGDGSGGIVDLIDDIIERMPKVYDVETVSEIYPTMYLNSMNTVLKQVRFISFYGIVVYVYVRVFYRN
jgi:hypothetical protein